MGFQELLRWERVNGLLLTVMGGCRDERTEIKRESLIWNFPLRKMRH